MHGECSEPKPQRPAALDIGENRFERTKVSVDVREERHGFRTRRAPQPFQYSPESVHSASHSAINKLGGMPGNDTRRLGRTPVRQLEKPPRVGSRIDEDNAPRRGKDIGNAQERKDGTPVQIVDGFDVKKQFIMPESEELEQHPAQQRSVLIPHFAAYLHALLTGNENAFDLKHRHPFP